MRLKGLLVGVIGGILLSGLLVYPLYIYLPGEIVPGWFHGQSNVLWVFVGLSVLALILIGLAGGRWSGLGESQTFLGGAAAGGIAAVIAYALIVSPATGVLGNQSIFRYGLVEVPDETSFTWLVIYGATETVWWGAVGFWLSVLSGVVLGGIGGWFAEPQPDERKDWSKLFPAIDPIMMVVAVVNFIITYAAYRALLDATMKSVSRSNFHGTYPISASFLLIDISSYGWILFWQVKLWRDLRQAPGKDKVQSLSWALASFVSLLLSIPLLFLGFLVFGTDAFVFVACLISALTGVLTFRDTFWTKRHLPVLPIQPPFAGFGLALRGGFVLSLFVTMTLMMGNIGIPLNLVEITIVAIAPLSGDPEYMSATGLANSVYLFPISFFSSIFVVNFLYLIVLLWSLRNIYRFLREYGLHLPDIIADPES